MGGSTADLGGIASQSGGNFGGGGDSGTGFDPSAADPGQGGGFGFPGDTSGTGGGFGGGNNFGSFQSNPFNPANLAGSPNDPVQVSQQQANLNPQGTSPGTGQQSAPPPQQQQDQSKQQPSAPATPPSEMQQLADLLLGKQTTGKGSGWFAPEAGNIGDPGGGFGTGPEATAGGAASAPGAAPNPNAPQPAWQPGEAPPGATAVGPSPPLQANQVPLPQPRPAGAPPRGPQLAGAPDQQAAVGAPQAPQLDTEGLTTGPTLEQAGKLPDQATPTQGTTPDQAQTAPEAPTSPQTAPQGGQPGGFGGQGGMPQFNPLQMLVDLLTKGPMGLFQDLAGLAGQGMPGMGGFPGGAQGQNPENFPWAPGYGPQNQTRNPQIDRQYGNTPQSVQQRQQSAPVSPQSPPVPGKNTPTTQGGTFVMNDQGQRVRVKDAQGNPIPGVDPDTGNFTSNAAARAAGQGGPGQPGAARTAPGARPNAPQALPEGQTRPPADVPVTPGQNVAMPIGTGRQNFPTYPYLAQQRSRMANEARNNPRVNDRLLAMAASEDERDPAGPIESLANRAEYTGRSLDQLLTPAFYGPMRPSNAGYRNYTTALSRIQRDPAYRARLQSAADGVWSGSNRLRGATDQGQAGDPNARTTSGRIAPQGGTRGAIYNDWGGGRGGVPGAAQFRMRQQQMLGTAPNAAPAAVPAAVRRDLPPPPPPNMASLYQGLDWV